MWPAPGSAVARPEELNGFGFTAGSGTSLVLCGAPGCGVEGGTGRTVLPRIFPYLKEGRGGTVSSEGPGALRAHPAALEGPGWVRRGKPRAAPAAQTTEPPAAQLCGPRPLGVCGGCWLAREDCPLPAGVGGERQISGMGSGSLPSPTVCWVLAPGTLSPSPWPVPPDQMTEERLRGPSFSAPHCSAAIPLHPPGSAGRHHKHCHL